MLQDGIVLLVSDNKVELNALFWREDLSLVLSLGSEKMVCDRVNIRMFGNKLNPELVSNLTLLWMKREAFRPLDIMREECVVQYPLEITSADMDRNVRKRFEYVLGR